MLSSALSPHLGMLSTTEERRGTTEQTSRSIGKIKNVQGVCPGHGLLFYPSSYRTSSRGSLVYCRYSIILKAGRKGGVREGKGALEVRQRQQERVAEK